MCPNVGLVAHTQGLCFLPASAGSLAAHAFWCVNNELLDRNGCRCLSQTVQAEQILSALALGHKMERSKHMAAAHIGSSKPE